MAARAERDRHHKTSLSIAAGNRGRKFVAAKSAATEQTELTAT
jgi:hypothetical protein